MPGSQDNGNGRRRIVIIGGGASGVFTAGRLERLAEGRFDITILEKEKRIGGHAHSAKEPAHDPEVSIDLGAQFFSPEAQPEYCDMLAEEEILDDPALVTSHEVGMTVWHQTRDELLFKVPDRFE